MVPNEPLGPSTNHIGIFAMTRNQFTLRSFINGGALVLLAIAATPAQAAVLSWNAAGKDWATGTNWWNSAVPGSGDIADFDVPTS